MLRAMLPVLLGPMLLTYEFPPEVRSLYDVDVRFDGYVPVMGGTKGQIDVKMTVAVQGGKPDADGRPQVTSEIDRFGMQLNGAKMPFDRSNVLSYFPKTTVSIDPRGKVLKTDAPNLSLPVKLPGLDVKRFPDITYLLLEFPEAGIETGQTFEFKKTFGGSEATYQVTVQEIAEGKAKFNIRVRQAYSAVEDSRGNPVEADAARNSVETSVEGTGTAEFDLNLKQVVSAEIVADAVSKVKDIESGETGERKLRTTLKVQRQGLQKLGTLRTLSR